MDVLGWIGELGGAQPEGGGVVGFGGACASEGEGSDVGTPLPLSLRMKLSLLHRVEVDKGNRRKGCES